MSTDISKARQRARPVIVLICLLPLSVSPSQAQIIGNIMPDNYGDSFTKGNIETGFGFAGQRYEEKQRLKRLRERYLELNPKNKGIVEVYDVDEYAEDEASPTTDAQAPAAEAE